MPQRGTKDRLPLQNVDFVGRSVENHDDPVRLRTHQPPRLPPEKDRTSKIDRLDC